MPAAGIVFVVLFVLTVVLIGDTGNTGQDAATELEGSGARFFLAFLVGTASTFALLTFYASLRDRMHALPGGDTAATLTVAPVAAASALLVGSLALMAGGEEVGGDTGISPELASFVMNAQYPFLVAAMMLIGFATAVACLALLRSGELPDWLCWAGVVAGVLQLAVFLFLPILLLLLWILVASAVLLSRRRVADPVH